MAKRLQGVLDEAPAVPDLAEELVSGELPAVARQKPPKSGTARAGLPAPTRAERGIPSRRLRDQELQHFKTL